jgi:hypothetical protein
VRKLADPPNSCKKRMKIFLRDHISRQTGAPVLLLPAALAILLADSAAAADVPEESRLP